MNAAEQEILASAQETAVVVLVPEADPVVAAHRMRLDVAASWGVPAHVSVVYPFVPPSGVDDAVVAGLGAAVAEVPVFGCAFRRTGWFGDDVLWLAPEPDEPFRRLTRAVFSAFPEHPPYGGVHGEPTPHLTVAEARLADPAAMRAADADVLPRLPLHARVEEAVLLAGRPEPGSWRRVRAFPLRRHPHGRPTLIGT